MGGTLAGATAAAGATVGAGITVGLGSTVARGGGPVSVPQAPPSTAAAIAADACRIHPTQSRLWSPPIIKRLCSCDRSSRRLRGRCPGIGYRVVDFRRGDVEWLEAAAAGPARYQDPAVHEQCCCVPVAASFYRIGCL